MKRTLCFLLLLCATPACRPYQVLANSSLERQVLSLTQLAPRLSPRVAELALQAASCATRANEDQELTKLAIIDYSLPSTEKRFWLFDLRLGTLLMEEFVAHGKHTGENWATSFSNERDSLKSSLGLFRISERYVGKHGDSLRLIGLEEGVNDRAYERSIVIHGADYVSPSFIAKHKRLGRSFGCPAFSRESVAKVIDHLEQSGGYLFSYFPESEWLRTSRFLGCDRVGSR